MPAFAADLEVTSRWRMRRSLILPTRIAAQVV